MRRRRNEGFTLIEALVALLVLSIGMLGVAAMQLNALQGAHAAYQRSIATLAAQDAQERLWEKLAENPDTLICPQESDVNGTGEGTWHAAWSNFLPELFSSPVQRQDNCEFEITVTWSEERFNEAEESFVYTVRLPGEVSP